MENDLSINGRRNYLRPQYKKLGTGISLAASGYITDVLEGMSKGALFSGSGSTVAANVGRATLQGLGRIGTGIAEGFFLDVGSKSVEATANVLQGYGESGQWNVLGDFASSYKDASLEDYNALKNIATTGGNGADWESAAMLLAPGGGSKKDGDGSHNNADANSNHTPTDTNTDTHKESSKKTPHTVVPADPNKPKPNEGEAHENGQVDPPGTFRDKNGRLRNAKGNKNGKKPGTFAKDPNSKASKKRRYNRSKAEKKKALLRDANDPNSKLDPEAKQYINDTNGNKVPDKRYNKDYKGDIDYAVHHKEPLYSEKSIEGKKALDKANNMETIPINEHLDTHRFCGNTYHDFGPSNQ